MKPGFMSSVCPQMTLQELIDAAKRHGYEGIEFRVEWDHKMGERRGAYILPEMRSATVVKSIGG